MEPLTLGPTPRAITFEEPLASGRWNNFCFKLPAGYQVDVMGQQVTTPNQSKLRVNVRLESKDGSYIAGRGGGQLHRSDGKFYCVGFSNFDDTNAEYVRASLSATDQFTAEQVSWAMHVK